MNIKEQNLQLTELKNEYIDTLQALDLIILDVIHILLPDSTTIYTEAQIESIISFLSGEKSIKDIRASIKDGVLTVASPTVKKNVGNAKSVKVPVQKTVKVPAKKVTKSKK